MPTADSYAGHDRLRQREKIRSVLSKDRCRLLGVFQETFVFYRRRCGVIQRFRNHDLLPRV